MKTGHISNSCLWYMTNGVEQPPTVRTSVSSTRVNIVVRNGRTETNLQLLGAVARLMQEGKSAVRTAP